MALLEQRGRRALRGGRGPLRLAVGPRLPPRVPRAARRYRGARPPAGARAHRDGHAARSPTTSSRSSVSRARRWSTPASSGQPRSSRCTHAERGAQARRARWSCSRADEGAGIVYAATVREADELGAGCARGHRASAATTASCKTRSARRARTRFMRGELARDGGDQGVRAGHRQARHPLRRSLQLPRLARELLPGGGPRGPRRRPARRRAALPAGGPARSRASSWAASTRAARSPGAVFAALPGGAPPHEARGWLRQGADRRRRCPSASSR